MVEYKCNICLYVTQRKNDYDRHTKSKKHLNLENIIDQKIKDIKTEHYTTLKIVKLECKNEILNVKLNMNDKFIKQCVSDKEKFANIAQTSVDTNKTSTSALSYIVKNFSNAPDIKPFKNFKFLKEKNDYKFLDNFLYMHKQRKLTPYITDMLIKYYKKANTTEQSVWNTDVNRLSYLVKNKNTKNNISKWMVDKKGIMLSSYAISPIIDKIKEKISSSLNTIKKDNKKDKDILRDICDNNSGSDNDEEINKSSVRERLIKTNNLIGLSYDLINELDDGTYANEILKQIANHFYFNDMQVNHEI